jgi:hypothetical protein
MPKKKNGGKRSLVGSTPDPKCIFSVVKRSSQKSKKKLCKNNPDLIQEVVEQTRPRLPSSSSSHKSDCKTNGAVVEQAPVQVHSETLNPGSIL